MTAPIVQKALHIALGTCVRASAHVLPAPAVRFLYRRATAGFGVALCLHRATERVTPGHPSPEMSARPNEIDELLRLISPLHSRDGSPLVMTFDDGYADAAEYVATRARRYPDVDWIFFVCPEKTEKQAGFRWDLYAEHRRRGARPGRLRSFLRADLSVDAENESSVLRALAAAPEYRLASVEQCRRLERLPNVTLGNHTDTHFGLTLLPDEEAAKDLLRSTLRFERLFGHPVGQYAFPFGGDDDVSTAHVTYLRSLRSALMWTTQGMPFVPENRLPGSVMPRFVYPGHWTPRAMALWIAVQSLRRRIWPRDLNETFGHPTAPAAAASEAAAGVSPPTAPASVGVAASGSAAVAAPVTATASAPTSPTAA